MTLDVNVTLAHERPKHHEHQSYTLDRFDHSQVGSEQEVQSSQAGPKRSDHAQTGQNQTQSRCFADDHFGCRNARSRSPW